MRNLLEYPVTAKEIFLKLKELARRREPELAVGDMTPLLLLTAANVIVVAEAIREAVVDAQNEGLITRPDHPLLIFKEQLDEAFNSQMPNRGTC